MKNHFKEFYSPTAEEVKAVWDGNPLVVLDTNILLNPYRYSKDTTEDMFLILESDVLKDKLWIPYQVAWEFQNNRLGAYYGSWNAVESILTAWKAKMDEFKRDTQKYWKRNPFFNEEAFDAVVRTAAEKLTEEMKKWKQDVEDYLNKDSIRDKITTLYEDKVGDDSTTEELQSLYKEGEKRFKDKVPPGFEDDTKEKRAKGLRHVFGDLIVWKQLMKKAKDENKNIIFVSGDQKIDWWEEWHGKKLRPRVELIKEFRDETKREIIFYTQLGFMKYAKKNLGLNTKDATITEVETVDTADTEENMEERRRCTEDILQRKVFMPNPYAASPAASVKKLALEEALGKFSPLGQIDTSAISKINSDYQKTQQNLVEVIQKLVAGSLN